MKIQLDYDNKVVTIEQRVNLKTLFDRVKVILDDWKEWELNCNVTMEWKSNPIVIPYLQHRPWWRDHPYYTTCDAGVLTTSTNCDSQVNINSLNVSCQPTSGVYQIELAES